MRLAFLPRLALVAALVVAAGCSNNTDKLEGTKWVSLAATIKGEDIPAGARFVEFLHDGHLLYIVAGRGYKGSYTLGMGSAVTFTLDEELDGRKIHPHKIVVDDEQLTLTRADGSQMIFRKTK